MTGSLSSLLLSPSPLVASAWKSFHDHGDNEEEEEQEEDNLRFDTRVGVVDGLNALVVVVMPI